jgi:dolichyl-phosphate-mannose-protein mannosyltransferase
MLGQPSSVVFDEVYFGNFTDYYYRGSYFFDIHPPLGKQLIYLGSIASGYHFNQTFARIDHPLDSTEMQRLRFWPCLAGSLVGPILFMTLKLLVISPQWCLTISIFASLDQALILESRFVLLEGFLLFFASLTMLLTAIISLRPNSPLWFVILGGLSAGATLSIKFTGAGVAFSLVFSLFISFPLNRALVYSLVASISGLSVFFLSFIAHFLMLRNPGPGCDFHPSWCHRLDSRKLNLPKSIHSLLRQMYWSNVKITESHPSSSRWWQWPLMLGKGTLMWVRANRHLICIGSPIVWYGSTIGILIWLLLLLKSQRVRSNLWIGFGYCISFFPFAFLTRVTWNYHYFMPLLYALVAGGIAMDVIAPHAEIVPAVLVVGAFLCFGIWFTLTYGTPMSERNYNQIMFSAWE